MRFMSSTTRRFAPLIIVALALSSCGDVGKPDFSGLGFGGGGNKKWETIVTEAQDMQSKNKPVEAEKLYKEAIEVCTKKFGENAAQTGTAVGYLASFYKARQDWKLAYNEYKRWKAIMQEVEPAGETMKNIDQDLRKIKEKMIQYNLVPDEVLKKRAERAEREKTDNKDAKGKK